MTGRIVRIEGESLIYFISSEGSKGIDIFMDHMDKHYFINLLRQQKVRSNLKFYGYVLLPKKYYFIMETRTNNLTNSMHRIKSDYANYFNRRHKRKDKLFRDRYTCYIIERNKCLREVSCYLHLLPKQDGVAKSPFQYKWSSLPGYINKEKRKDWVDYDCILNTYNKESHKASLNYQKYINNSLKEQISSPFENLKGSIILGSENFKKETCQKQQLKKTPQRNEVLLAKNIIHSVIQSFSWFSLKFEKRKFDKTNLSRNAAIYFLKKYTDLSNQQISHYFKPLRKSSISQMSRRFNLAKERYEAIKKISDSLEEKINRFSFL